MPNSKRRKKQVAASKKQAEKAKKQVKDRDQKENVALPGPASKLSKKRSDGHKQATPESTGWMGGLYNWCQSGVSQVSV